MSVLAGKVKTVGGFRALLGYIGEIERFTD